MGSDDDRVELSGDVAFEAADGFASGLSFGDASLDVAAAACLPAESGKDDRVESRVGLTVTAAVEPSALCLARGGFHRAHPAERGK
jgi:hypothetical protein